MKKNSYEGRTDVGCIHYDWCNVSWSKESKLKEKENFDIIRIGLCKGITGKGKCLYTIDFYLDKKYKHGEEIVKRISCGKLINEKEEQLLNESIELKLLPKKHIWNDLLKRYALQKHCIIHNIRTHHDKNTWARIELANWD
jgi:hypothetical protein